MDRQRVSDGDQLLTVLIAQYVGPIHVFRPSRQGSQIIISKPQISYLIKQKITGYWLIRVCILAIGAHQASICPGLWLRLITGAVVQLGQSETTFIDMAHEKDQTSLKPKVSHTISIVLSIILKQYHLKQNIYQLIAQ